MAMWKTSEAVAIIRQIEAILIPLGCHCALGGSVIMKGESDKDVDVFIYLHTSTPLGMKGLREKVEETLAFELHADIEKRWKATPFVEGVPIYFDKGVTKMIYREKRIDLFFVATFVTG